MVLPRKFQNSKQILRKIQKSIAPEDGQQYMLNRNPRNLEFLRIAHKPGGYKLDDNKNCFWNKLNIISTGKYVTVQMVHFDKGPIVEASTQEWAIKKQLFKPCDTSAFTNLGKVFAQRCLESGFIEMACDYKPVQGGKIHSMLKEVKAGGVVLKEPGRARTEEYSDRYVGKTERPYSDWQEH